MTFEVPFWCVLLFVGLGVLAFVDLYCSTR